MKGTTRAAVKAFIVSKIRSVTCEDLIWLADTYGLEDNDFEIAEYFDVVASRVERYLQYPEFPPTLLERGMNGDVEAARKFLFGAGMTNKDGTLKEHLQSLPEDTQ